MTRRLSGLVVAATIAVMSASCAPTGAELEPPGDTSVEPSAWRTVPAGPLSARWSALAVWTGTEVLVVGGSAGRPCPDGASCAAPERILADGAAYDPTTRTWRPIAPAPVPVMAGQPVVVDGTVYVNAYAGPAAPTLLAYDIAADRWSRPPTPPGDSELLTAAGDRPVIYPGSHEQGAGGTGYALDPATGRWAALPADPLGKGFDRRFAWTGEALVLLDRELVPNPGADGPSIARAAVLTDPFGPDAAWKRLPDSEVMSTDPVLVDGDLLIIPNVGGADGGQVNGYGREYPFGGVLDVPANRWSGLPPEDLPMLAGAFGADSALYVGHAGAVLDVERGAWLTTPRLPGATRLSAAAVVAAGRDLFVFGGVAWRTDDKGELRDTGWIWTPR